ncbi:MAG: GreA/GreB family elongation factor [Burkholderiales bacterium]|nr:GreA/GreB family elongation factor [Burkholderiales bacterium]
MWTNEETVLTASDAEALALMLGDCTRCSPGRAQGLIGVLQTADIVPDASFPADRVPMGAAVTYEHFDGVTRARIVLVYPGAAAPETGLVSVLSPFGAAVLGRAVGDVIEAPPPDGRRGPVRITRVERALRSARTKDAVEEELHA